MERDELLQYLEAVHTESLAAARRYAVIRFAADDFTRVRDRFGHEVAAAVRHLLAVTARQLLRRRGRIGRGDGDEFLCVLPDTDAATAATLAEQLRARIVNQILPMADAVTTISVSLGIAAAPELDATTPRLLAAAGQALQQAQHAGGNRVVVAGGAPPAIRGLGTLVAEALREQRVTAAYQAVFSLENGALVAEEALARLITPDDRVLPAGEFIAATHQLQLTHEIDRAIVAAALEHNAQARARGSALPLFVKLGAGWLHHPERLAELPAAHSGVVLEIAEADLPADAAAVRRLFAPFSALGLKLALDDFGCHPASLQHLAELPVSYVKLDGRLIQRLHEAWARALVRRLHHRARAHGLITLAELVEQERQANILREIGVPWAQGHYFSRAEVDERQASARRRLNARRAQGYNQPRSGHDS